MVRVTDLAKRYGTQLAVDGVSFEIRAGETFGLLGPNGAGKTTTILCLVGGLAPDSGTVRIDGDGDPSRPDVRRRIGVAPQALSLYDELTAEENLVFFGRLFGLFGARLRERVSACLAFAGLESRKGDRVAAYSGGMQRRLNLACAIVHDPPLLVLDEPTVGVDPQSRNHIFESIARLRAAGRTILYTTHYMEEAERLCDRVAIMDRGRILALDTVDGLIARHAGMAVVEGSLARPPRDPALLGAGLEGSSFHIETKAPLEEIARLSAAGVEFSTLNVRRADLESVFLTLTGRSLRDA